MWDILDENTLIMSYSTIFMVYFAAVYFVYRLSRFFNR